MPQFDLGANYYIIFIFYILYFIYYIAYISIVNTIFKHTKVFLLMKEHKNNFKKYFKNKNEMVVVIKSWNIKNKNLVKWY